MFKIAPVFILLKGQIVPKHQTFEDSEYMQLKDYLIPSPSLRLETYCTYDLQIKLTLPQFSFKDMH